MIRNKHEKPKTESFPVQRFTTMPETCFFEKSERMWSKIMLLMVALFLVNPTLNALDFQQYTNETTHLVKKGDTLYSLSKSYGVKVADIRRLNGMGSSNDIRIGELLQIPESETYRYRMDVNNVPPIRGLIESEYEPEANRRTSRSSWKDAQRSKAVHEKSAASRGSRDAYKPERPKYAIQKRSPQRSYYQRSRSQRSRYQRNRDVRINYPQNQKRYKRSNTGDYFYTSDRFGEGPKGDVQLHVEKIRITENSTILTFLLENQGENSIQIKLAKNGNKKAWYLTDRSFGREYHLKTIDYLDRWKFGLSYKLKGYSSQSFTAEFERLDNDVFNFHLIEGQDMKPGNWNIFEIELKDDREEDYYDKKEEEETRIFNKRKSRYEDLSYNYPTSDWEQDVFYHTPPEVFDLIDKLDAKRGQRNFINERRNRIQSNDKVEGISRDGGSLDEYFRAGKRTRSNAYIYYYRVKEGDSLFKIAQRYGSTKNELREINELESDELRIGKIIMVVRRD